MKTDPSRPLPGTAVRRPPRGAERFREDPDRQAGLVRFRTTLNLLLILASLLVLLWFDRVGREGRTFPLMTTAGDERAPVYWVSTESEIYGILKSLGVKGVELVHLNRFFNMGEFSPEEQNRSRPFPVQPYDLRADYESGLDSGNWLFIATRTGLVRRVWNVMPDTVFQERLGPLQEDHYSRQSDGSVRGFTYDIPQNITTLSMLPQFPVEAVVVTLDAGFFLEPAEPDTVARILRSRLPKTAVLILSKGLDESDITVEARERLHRFLLHWYPG